MKSAPIIDVKPDARPTVSVLLTRHVALVHVSMVAEVTRNAKLMKYAMITNVRTPAKRQVFVVRMPCVSLSTNTLDVLVHLVSKVIQRLNRVASEYHLCVQPLRNALKVTCV